MLLFICDQARHVEDRWLFPVITQASIQVNFDNNHNQNMSRQKDANPSELSDFAPREM